MDTIARARVRAGTHGMHLEALDNAPCQAVVLDDDETVIARCRYTLGNHPRAKASAAGRYLHEDVEQTRRWYIDGEGVTHMALKPTQCRGCRHAEHAPGQCPEQVYGAEAVLGHHQHYCRCNVPAVAA